MIQELHDLYMVVIKNDFHYVLTVREEDPIIGPSYYSFLINRYSDDGEVNRIHRYEHDNPVYIYTNFNEYYTKLINGELDESIVLS